MARIGRRSKHQTTNLGVGSSNLSGRAKIDKTLALLNLFVGSLNKKENSSVAINQRLFTEGASLSLSYQGEVNR